MLMYSWQQVTIIKSHYNEGKTKCKFYLIPNEYLPSEPFLCVINTVGFNNVDLFSYKGVLIDSRSLYGNSCHKYLKGLGISSVYFKDLKTMEHFKFEDRIYVKCQSIIGGGYNINSLSRHGFTKFNDHDLVQLMECNYV